MNTHVLAVMLLGWAGAATPPSLPPDAPGHGLLTHVNALRTAGLACPDGVRPPTTALTWDDTLAQAAQQQATYIAASGQVTHTGADGSDPHDRARAVGVRATSVAEIVYLGQRPDPLRALNWWKHSAIHCRIMTDAGYLRAGASVVSGRSGLALVVVLSGAE